MKTVLKTIPLTALLFALSVSLSAQQRANRTMQAPKQKEGMMHQRMMDMLDLDAEQSQKVKTIHLNGEKSMLAFTNKIAEKKARLQTLVTADNYDSKAVNKVITEMSELQKDRMITKYAHRQQVRELLTDAQRVKFDRFHLNKQHMKGMNGMQGKHNMRGKQNRR
jgi:Spy/CpxP family protein refolding chaperone